MGMLQDGRWINSWYDTKSTRGRFVRRSAQFRNWITPDGSQGPSGIDGFKAEEGRYHLYISLACPWAHRTLIFRTLKGLEKMISLSIVHWFMAENGWTFDSTDGALPDTVNNAEFLYQVYTAAKSDYTGRVTVPVLWDKKNNTIVSNESSEIIRMFNTAFDRIGANSCDFYPKEFRKEIDELNSRIYENLNNGVYKTGFATSQEAYEEAIEPLFKTLDWLEERLSNRRFLLGNQITEADWRLFTTLVRFDPVYVGHFKCNRHRIADYTNLSGYVRDLYQQPGIAATVNLDHIKKHYYASHETINPSRVIPLGPYVDFTLSHDRSRLS